MTADCSGAGICSTSAMVEQSCVHFMQCLQFILEYAHNDFMHHVLAHCVECSGLFHLHAMPSVCPCNSLCSHHCREKYRRHNPALFEAVMIQINLYMQCQRMLQLLMQLLISHEDAHTPQAVIYNLGLDGKMKFEPK